MSPTLPRDLSLTLSTPGLETENRWGLRSTTRRGDSPTPRGLLEAPLDGCAVIHAELWVLSLSLSLSLGGEGYLSTFGGMAGILVKF